MHEGEIRAAVPAVQFGARARQRKGAKRTPYSSPFAAWTVVICTASASLSRRSSASSRSASARAWRPASQRRRSSGGRRPALSARWRSCGDVADVRDAALAVGVGGGGGPRRASSREERSEGAEHAVAPPEACQVVEASDEVAPGAGSASSSVDLLGGSGPTTPWRGRRGRRRRRGGGRWRVRTRSSSSVSRAPARRRRWLTTLGTPACRRAACTSSACAVRADEHGEVAGPERRGGRSR